MAFKSKCSFVAAIVAVALGSATAFAQSSDPAAPTSGQQNQIRHKVSTDQAKATALQAVPGRIVGDPELKLDGNEWVYVVTVQDGKKSKRVWVDADTGQMVGIDVYEKKNGKVNKNLEKKLDKALKKPKKPKKTKKSTKRKPKITVDRYGNVIVR